MCVLTKTCGHGIEGEKEEVEAKKRGKKIC